MAETSVWQRQDGFPTDAYFTAVEHALRARGVLFADSCRNEDWEYTLELWDAEDPREDGPMSWADHGLYVSWRVAEDSEAQHADDFGTFQNDLGWYWVPYTKPEALGDYAQSFGLPYLATPDAVAQAVAELLGAAPAS